MWVGGCVCVCVCARARVCVCARAEGAVTKWQRPGWSCIRVMQGKRAVCLNALCVVCCALVAESRHSLWQRAVTVHGCPGITLPPDVATKFLLGPGLCASKPWSGCVEAGSWAVEVR